MEYKKFMKDSLAQHLLPFKVRLLILDAEYVLKKMKGWTGNQRNQQVIDSQCQSIHWQTERLKYCSNLFLMDESEENYQLLMKQIRATKFLTKYQEKIVENMQ